MTAVGFKRAYILSVFAAFGVLLPKHCSPAVAAFFHLVLARGIMGAADGSWEETGEGCRGSRQSQRTAVQSRGLYSNVNTAGTLTWRDTVMKTDMASCNSLSLRVFQDKRTGTFQFLLIYLQLTSIYILMLTCKVLYFWSYFVLFVCLLIYYCFICFVFLVLHIVCWLKGVWED